MLLSLFVEQLQLEKNASVRIAIALEYFIFLMGSLSRPRLVIRSLMFLYFYVFM